MGRAPIVYALLTAAVPACTSWRAVTRDDVLALAQQPDVSHRTLVVDGEMRRVGGETPIILHVVGGDVGPAPARCLHGAGEAVRLDEPPRDLNPADINSAELRLYDAHNTALVIAVPTIAAAVTTLIILLVSWRKTFNPLGSP